jgi:hypothetical protein
VVVNLAREAWGAARQRYPGLQGVLVTAPPALLARRLAARGREKTADAADRAADAATAGFRRLPACVPTCVWRNDLEKLIDTLGDEPGIRSDAIIALSTVVGAMTLARIVSDTPLPEEILNGAKDRLHRYVGPFALEVSTQARDPSAFSCRGRWDG